MRLENSIFLTERDQSFMYTYLLTGDRSFDSTLFCIRDQYFTKQFRYEESNLSR